MTKKNTRRGHELAMTEASKSDDRVLSRPGGHPVVTTYLARIGSGSRRTMKGALDTIAHIASRNKSDAMSFDWSSLRYEHTAAIRRVLEERYAPATANKIMSALRGALRDTWRLGLMSAEDFHRAIDLPPVKGESEPKGRALSAGELMALFRACAEDRSPAGARDAAMTALMYGAGIRRAEVVTVDVGDYDRKTGALRVRQTKGRKPRTVYATNGAFDALDDWISIRGTKAGPLFLPIRKDGTIEHRRPTPQAVYLALQRRGEQAGLDSFTPHDLRRTFIGDLLDSGADISTVRALAGHAQVNTTVRYDRRGERTKRKAAELLSVPYRRPRREGG